MVLRPFRALCPVPGNLDPWAFANKNPDGLDLQTLSHPQGEPGERSKFVRYARSASLLHQAIAQNQLAKTETASFYLAEKVGQEPSTHLIALLDLDQPLHPLEKPNPRETTERTWLTEATLTQFDPVPAIPHHPAELSDLPRKTLFESGPWILSAIQDPDAIQTVQTAVQDLTPLLVGQTSTAEAIRQFFAAKKARNPNRPPGAVQISLQLEPKSRPLRSLPVVLATNPLGPDNLQRRLLEHFDLRPTSNEQLMATLRDQNLKGTGVFGLALPGGYTFTAQAKDIDSLAGELALATGVQNFDHQVLQGFVFEKLFGLTNLDVFTYTRTSQAAFDLVGDNGAAFFLPDPEIPSLEDIAIETGVFPPRSIDVAAPVPSGLALWSLNDLQA